MDGKDLLAIYRNYIACLQEREEYGEQYGDTDIVLDYYEKKLGDALVLRREKDNNGRFKEEY